MPDKQTITFRLDRSLIRALRVQGAYNDRSINGELSAVLREVFGNEKAPDHALESKSDASQQ